MMPALLGSARPQLGTGTSLELLPARAGHPDDPLIYWPVNHPCPSCFQPHSPKPLTLGAGLQVPTSPCSAGPGSLLPPSRQLGTTHCPALGNVSPSLQPIPKPEMQRCQEERQEPLLPGSKGGERRRRRLGCDPESQIPGLALVGVEGMVCQGCPGWQSRCSAVMHGSVELCQSWQGAGTRRAVPGTAPALLL